MTIGWVHKVTLSSGTDTGTYVTPTYTPGQASRLALIAVLRKGATNFGGITSITGSSISGAVSVASVTFGSQNNIKSELWRALSTGTPGAVTISCPDTNLLCLAHIVEMNGVNTGTRMGVVQATSASGVNTSAQSGGTLAAFASTDNATYAMFGGGGTGGTTATSHTVEAGWTKLFESGITDAAGGGDLFTVVRNNNDLTPTSTSSDTERWAGIAVELDASAISTDKARPLNVMSQAVSRASRI